MNSKSVTLLIIVCRPVLQTYLKVLVVEFGYWNLMIFDNLDKDDGYYRAMDY